MTRRCNLCDEEKSLGTYLILNYDKDGEEISRVICHECANNLLIGIHQFYKVFNEIIHRLKLN